MAKGLKDAITKCMETRDLNPLAHVPLYALSSLYGMAVRMRLGLYSKKILKSRKLPCKVISIGNITVGGSGKTPMTMFLAEYLSKKGIRVGILSRGYGGSLEGNTVVVSDGKQVLHGPNEVGDEPYLMALRLKDIPVIIGRDRYVSGLLAVKRFGTEVLVLDDGFQHIALERDINILLIDSARRFGSGYLLPRGLLREPLFAMKRADIVMLKDGNKNTLKPIDGLPAISFRYMATGIINEPGSDKLDIGLLKNKKVLAFAGIANPSAFLKTIDEAGAKVLSSIFFSDHHCYSSSDMERIQRTVVDAGSIDFIVTTEKDMVKLKDVPDFGTKIYAVSVDVVVDDIAELERYITTRLGIN